jgi:FAD-dependent urate hydroxylase
MDQCDIAIVGAGPYGLSAAAHLKQLKGLEVRVFGEPMTFWDCNMPAGMFLRSGWSATHIADPHNALTLEAFQAEGGGKFSTPVPLDRFVQYGVWYQKQAVPDLDRRKVISVETAPSGFRLTLDDGNQVAARRVVIAAGIGSFAWRPPEFHGFPASLVSHSSEHHKFSKYSGKQILVVGGGQSALESAALMHESGADVEVVARTNRIHWLQGTASTLLHYGLGKGVKQLLYAPTDVGPAVLSQLCARPDLIRLMPRALQDKLRKRAVRPAGARWLVQRLKDVPVRLGQSVASAVLAGDKVKVRLADGSERKVDHVLLGTGYRVDVSRYSFLTPELVDSISSINGYPRLQAGLETSVPGLHILGAPGAWSFGPVMQFVSGTTYASKTLTRFIAAKSRTQQGQRKPNE